MELGSRNSRDATPLDETLDAVTPQATPHEAWRSPRVALVEGSGPQLTSMTECLLRSRLRGAALVLCFGFFVFLVRPYFSEQREIVSMPLLEAFHVLVVLVLAAYGTMLCTKCNVSLRSLRLAELLIFGLPGAFFFYLTYLGLDFCVRHEDAVGVVMVSTRAAIFSLLLMFVYSMFIPNNWRRSAVVVSAIAAAPLLVTAWMTLEHEMVLTALTVDNLIGLVLTMLVSVVATTYGTHMINTLRRDAFEAKQLGQYRLRKRLGAGGMGEVYLAEHQLLKRPCAIKLIHPRQADDPRAMARFEREVQATARLSHWNTVEIFDYGHTEDGTFYYVMEYLPGSSLGELVERHGPLPPERVAYLLEQTCRALREAHGVGLVHRDIKPGNIFAAQRGGVYDVAKLLDFGLVKPSFDGGKPSDLTQDGSITGSPLYMSPEQALGVQETDARSDIYSLGAVAYYLLTGHPPFERESPLEILFAHAREEVLPPSQLRGEIPAELEQIVLRCLAKKPEDRFQTAESLASALAECELPERWSESRAAEWWRSTESELSLPAAAAV